MSFECLFGSFLVFLIVVFALDASHTLRVVLSFWGAVFFLWYRLSGVLKEVSGVPIYFVFYHFDFCW